MTIDFSAIFKVFSRRETNKQRQLSPLTESFRHRIFMLLTNVLSGAGEGFYSQGNYIEEFFGVIRQKLLFHVGRPVLSLRRTATQDDDTYNYLLECSDAEFLDFLELALGSETTRYLRIFPGNDSRLIEEINAAFDADNLPYQLTSYVWEEGVEERFGNPASTYKLIHYPQVIFREDQVLYSYAVEPVLRFLAQKGLESANREFLNALADYRKGDYGDCLVKCGSAFESTLKLICHKRKWRYDQRDTAATLLDTYFANSQLSSFFKQPLLLIGTIRNRLSTAHGSGAVQKDVQQHIARYAVNSTAAAILLLTDEEWM